MLDDTRETRIRELEDALAYIAQEARSARMALCENELTIRLDNILRRIAALEVTRDDHS